MDKMYSCKELAAHYGVKTITIWDWVRNGKLPAVKIGKEYRIRESDVKAFEAARQTV